LFYNIITINKIVQSIYKRWKNKLRNYIDDEIYFLLQIQLYRAFFYFSRIANMQAHNSNSGNNNEREEKRKEENINCVFSPAASSANRFITFIITLLQRNK